MAGVMTLAELSAYLGHMDGAGVVALVHSGVLPQPLSGVNPNLPAARWDADAVDRALDIAREINSPFLPRRSVGSRKRSRPSETADITQDAGRAETSIHAWTLPRLRRLIQQAEVASIPREAVIAVLIDLLEGPEFNPDKIEAGSV